MTCPFCRGGVSGHKADCVAILAYTIGWMKGRWEPPSEVLQPVIFTGPAALEPYFARGVLRGAYESAWYESLHGSTCPGPSELLRQESCSVV